MCPASQGLLDGGMFGNDNSLDADRKLLVEGCAEIVGLRLMCASDEDRYMDPVERSAVRAEVDLIIQSIGSQRVETHSRASVTSSLPLFSSSQLLSPPGFQIVDLSAGLTARAEQHIGRVCSAVDIDLNQIVQPSSLHSARIAEAIGTVRCASGVPGAAIIDRMYGGLVVRDCHFESSFVAAAPCLVLLNEGLLDDAVLLADALLHESCHQKSFDLMGVRSIARDHTQSRVEPFTLPWNWVNGAPRTMSPIRMLSAMHVYVHLLAFHRYAIAAELHSRYELVEEYIRRCGFFVRVAQLSGLDPDLGPDGRKMVKWLTGAYQDQLHLLTEMGFTVQSPWAQTAEIQAASRNGHG